MKLGRYISSTVKRFFLLALSFPFVISCDVEDMFLPDPLPYVFVRAEIPLNNIENQPLHQLKWMYLDDEGLRGLIIYKESDLKYRAFERNCPFEFQKACATVDMHSSGFYMECQCEDEMHYSLDGLPTKGEGRYRLREYFTTVDQNILYINSEGF